MWGCVVECDGECGAVWWSVRERWGCVVECDGEVGLCGGV